MWEKSNTNYFNVIKNYGILILNTILLEFVKTSHCDVQQKVLWDRFVCESLLGNVCENGMTF